MSEIEIERTWLIDKRDLPNFSNGKVYWWNIDENRRYWTSIEKGNEVRYVHGIYRDRFPDKIIKKRYVNSFNITRDIKENKPYIFYKKMIKIDDPKDPTLRKESYKDITKSEFDNNNNYIVAADKIYCKNLNTMMEELQNWDGIEFKNKNYYEEYKNYDKLGITSFLFNLRNFINGNKIYMVEIEFKNQLSSSKFKPPKLFGKEVTGIPEYRGKLLAKNNLR